MRLRLWSLRVLAMVLVVSVVSERLPNLWRFFLWVTDDTRNRSNFVC